MRDKIPRTLKGWDEYLFNFTKKRVGLYELSLVVAYEILRFDLRYLDVSPGRLPKICTGGYSKERKQIRKMIKKSEGLKKRFIKVYSKYLQLYGIRPGEIRHIENECPEIFQEIEKIERDCKENLTRSLPWIKKGNITATKHRIAFIFAQVIKKENGQPNWAVIESLLKWFWKRFEKTVYRDELSGGAGLVFITEKTLSNAYSKAMKNPEKKLSIEQSARDYYSFLRSGFGQRIAFRKNYIQFGPFVPVGMDIWSRHPLVFFPDGKNLKEKTGRKRYFQEGRSWNRRMSNLMNGWVSFQRAARKCEKE
jgi:hypothetical protein